MGFSVSGAAAVLFVGLLVSATILYPTVDGNTERRLEALDARDDRSLTRQNTAIETANATYNSSSEELTVTVENVGASTLSVSNVDLIVDGEYATPSMQNATVGNDSTTDVWAPGETLTLTRTESSAPERIKVVTGPGIAITATVEVI